MPDVHILGGYIDVKHDNRQAGDSPHAIKGRHSRFWLRFFKLSRKPGVYERVFAVE